MEITYFAVGVVGFLLGVLLTWLAMMDKRERAELRRRVEDLETQAEKRRHTHRTIAGLEDATAVIIDAEIEVDALMARLQTVHRILGKTREGPESYENNEWKSSAGSA